MFGGPRGLYEYEILSYRVAAVRYSDGATLTPVSDPRLPRGTRALVRVVLRPKLGKGRRLIPFPREQWLDARGRVLPMPVIGRANAVEHLPKRTESDLKKVRERRREIPVIRRRISEMYEKSAEVRDAIEDSLDDLNVRKG